MSAPLQILTRPRGGAVVNLSGEVISSSGSAGLRINIDGTLDSRKGSGPTYAQIDAPTDWIIPNFAAGLKTYHFFLLITESNMDPGSDLMNQWVELVDELEWWHTSSGLTRNSTLKVSSDGGSTELDTGVYAFTVP